MGTAMSDLPSGRQRSEDAEKTSSLWERLLRWSGLPVGESDHDGNDDSGEPAALDKNERTLIQNVLTLRRKSAWDVMVPRVDIVAIDCDTSLDAAIKVMLDHGHSRLPVYRDDLDHIQGMIHLKDLMAAVNDGHPALVTEIMRKAMFVAPSMRVLDLLSQMRQQRLHMAFVIDEFGGIDGLITIEDLVEEIVGEIEDEHDDNTDAPSIEEQPDGSLRADARTPVPELEEHLGLKLLPADAEEDVDTVGGLLFMLSGRVPAPGEIIEHPAGLRFEILEADQRRIHRLAVHRTEPQTTESSHDS